MAKYKLNEAELHFKKELEKKGYKFLEKDGEKPVIIAEPIHENLRNRLENAHQDKKDEQLNHLKMHSVPFFFDSNGNVCANWFPYY